MARCMTCDKDVAFALQVSHSNRKTARTWKPNLQTVRANVNGQVKKIKVCTNCLRSGKVERV